MTMIEEALTQTTDTKACEIGPGATEATAKKFPSKGELRRELSVIRDNWSDLSAKIRAQLMPFAEVKESLAKVGAPAEPEEIGVSRVRFRETFAGVPYMRARYFGADLVQRLGLMPALLDRLFGVGGVWEVK